jgi:hypothetical protein
VKAHKCFCSDETQKPPLGGFCVSSAELLLTEAVQVIAIFPYVKIAGNLLHKHTVFVHLLFLSSLRSLRTPGPSRLFLHYE